MKTQLFFAILLFSLPVLSQNRQPGFNPQVPGLISPEKTRAATGNRSLVQLYDSIYHWYWDQETIGWTLNYKMTDIVYDAGNNRTSELRQDWNGSTWENSILRTYSYDASNNLLNETSQNWDGSAWVNLWQLNNTYDANNNLLSKLIQNWNGNAWENSKLHTFAYDAHNNETCRMHQNWNNNSWENEGQILFTYDAYNNMISINIQDWNGSSWINYSLTTYSYNSSNNRITSLGQDWNGSNWSNDFFNTYTYDASDNLVSLLSQDWDGLAWQNAWLYTYTYDAANNLVKELGQDYIGIALLNSFQYLYTYDGNNFIVTQSLTGWDDSGDVTYSDSTHNYFHTVLGINDLTEPMDDISVCPNPSSETITIRLPDGIGLKNTFLEICNFNGQTIFSRQVMQPSAVVDASIWPIGVYIIRLRNDRKVHMSKFIIYQP